MDVRLVLILGVCVTSSSGRSSGPGLRNYSLKLPPNVETVGQQNRYLTAVSSVHNSYLMYIPASSKQSANVSWPTFNRYDAAFAQDMSKNRSARATRTSCRDKFQIECSNGDCVNLEHVCDGVDDCYSGFDEVDCQDHKCPDSYHFRCNTGQCVDMLKRCDGKADCSDKSDEQNCDESVCPWVMNQFDSYYRCDNGQCVRLISRCDNGSTESTNCNDGSDELNCDDYECPSFMFKCKNGFCMPLQYRCNGHTGEGNCHDGSDEEDCESSDCKQWLSCSDGQCYPIFFRCDGEELCSDGSDEDGCEKSECSKFYERRCKSGECIDGDYFCDGKYDCLDHSDEENCQLAKCSNDMYRCRSGFCSRYNLCLNPIVCENDDREHCGTGYCSEDYIQCGNNACKHYVSRCDNMTDCTDGIDEINCGAAECRPDQIDCGDGNCIPMTFACDKYNHCKNGADERKCFEKAECLTNNGISCLDAKGALTCLTEKQICDRKADCSFLEDERHCFTVCPPNCTCVNGRVDCSNEMMTVSLQLTNTTWPFENNLSVHNDKTYSLALTTIHSLILRYSNLVVVPSQSFVYIPQLQILDLSHNKITTLSSGDFNGLYRLSILNLSFNMISQIDGGVFKGLRILNLHLEKNTIKVFDSNIFYGLAADGKIHTDAYKFCCLKPAHLPADKCFPEPDQFSSCKDLIKDSLLRVLLWTIGCFALIGNGTTVIVKLRRDFTNKTKPYFIFVLNLCVADSLMGVYMLIIATADEYFRGYYITKDEYWRESWWCSASGMLSMVSSEASVLLIMLITVDRFLIIKYPFGQKKIGRKLAVSLSLGAWITAVSLAVVPLLVFRSSSNGFYGISGVCVSLPLTHTEREGWQYSIFVYVGLNLILFLFIGAGQVFIFWEIVSARRKNSIATLRSDNYKIAIRLALVAASDFLCWMPIGCLCILTMSNILISPDAYAFMIIFVLPINSVLNPFIYTAVARFC